MEWLNPEFSRTKKALTQTTKRLANLSKMLNIAPGEEKLELEANGAPDFISRVNIYDRIIQGKPGGSAIWFPILLTHTPLKDSSCYDLEYIHPGNNYLMVGLTSIENKSLANDHNLPGSMYLYLVGSGMHINGIHRPDIAKYTGVGQSKLRVRINLTKNEVQWEQLTPPYFVIACVPIPPEMRSKELYPSL